MMILTDVLFALLNYFYELLKNLENFLTKYPIHECIGVGLKEIS